MEIKIDHIMFPVFFNHAFIDLIENTWKERGIGHVFSQPPNDFYKAVFIQSKSFYVEHLSTVKTEPYWSNAILLVVDKKYWGHYENPAMVNENFLVPYFGSGYQLVNPDFPHLNDRMENPVAYDGLQIFISKALEQELLNMAGQSWTLPENGKIQVHNDLHHLHDIVVIDENSKLIAPLFQSNPLLRDHF